MGCRGWVLCGVVLLAGCAAEPAAPPDAELPSAVTPLPGASPAGASPPGSPARNSTFRPPEALPPAAPRRAPTNPDRPAIPASAVPPPTAQPVAPDAMLVAGQPVPTGTRIVKFNEPGGYNAYATPAFYGPRVDRFDNGRPDTPPDDALRLAEHGYTFAELVPVIDQFVIHYDATGLAGRTFDVLQHDRGLSCHFLLDLDGTIYQTLDLQERAWHARESNSRSVGIEIANVGAFAAGAANDFSRWYRADTGGRTSLVLPPGHGVRDAGRALRPARDEPVLGRIHGRLLVQYDLTDAQYEALIHLTAALCRTFPKLDPRYPGSPGPARSDVLTPAERSAFRGLVGHYHLTEDKIDPGPAFDWERVLEGVKRELATP